MTTHFVSGSCSIGFALPACQTRLTTKSGSVCREGSSDLKLVTCKKCLASGKYRRVAKAAK